MTYYQRLVKRAMAAMEQAPMSTVLLDAETLAVLAKSTDSAKVALSAKNAAFNGRYPVIIKKPRHDEIFSGGAYVLSLSEEKNSRNH